jgi:S-DNA-T family DNA segregation ATPase FtsK/SpoIIIE
MALVIIRVFDALLYKATVSPGEEFTIGSGKKDEIFIEDLAPAQFKFALKKDLLHISAKKVSDFSKTALSANPVAQTISAECGLSVCWGGSTGESDQTFRLPYRGIVKLGRATDNTITIADNMVSRYQLTFQCEEGSIRVEDGTNGKGSTNGTYLNGKRLVKAKLESGDVLDVMHIRITLRNSELFFENVGSKLVFNQSSTNMGSTKGDGRHLRYRRSPRTREQLPYEEIVLAKPPIKAHAFEKRRGLFATLLGSGAMVGASVAMGIASPALLAARAASLVAPVANVAMGSSANRRGQKQYEEYQRARQEKYGAYIESQKAIILLTADKQREILTRENPSPMSCLMTMQELKRSLWERCPTDPDFLQVRLGMGYENLCVPVKAPTDGNGFQLEDDEVEELAKSIIEETRIVDNIPARVDLRAYHTVGLIGERKKVVGLLRNMLMALTTAHFYQDVKIVGIFDEQEKKTWESIRWLPHLWDEEQQTRFLAFNATDVNTLNDLFHDLLHSRTARSTEHPQQPTPHYIFILGSYQFAERASMMKELLLNQPEMACTTLFAYDLGDISPEEQMTYLPSKCQFIINTDDEYGASAYDVTKVNHKFIFTPDTLPEEDVFDRFCRTMAAIEVKSGVERLELPNTVTFLQGMGVDTVQELDAWANWENNSPEKVLEAPIAAGTGGKNFSLDLVNHGPHGLVAGTSGSGKSELLTTLLLSIAVRYHPYDVSFVVIDYKGGGLANTLEGLPHMVGKITNIGTNIQRSMISLDSELKRRQRIFDEVKVNKFSDYMRGFHSGKFKEPLPRLLIVADEFRELRQQEPEFMKSLISAATIGRSLGIHLILATQNPSGIIDDQIRANSNFAICLKVQNVAASRDMIQKPDAAHLSQTGRAYVRVGDDEIYEQVQSFWCGAPYMGKKHAVAVGNQVRLVQINGQRLKTVYEEKTRFQSELDELKAVSKYLTAVAAEHDLRKMPCPWLPELPEQLYFRGLETTAAFDGERWYPGMPWLKVPLGLFDRPEVQTQGTLYLDLEEVGHCGIYGNSGSGKTTMLKTILMALGRWYTPNDVQMYIVDLGSWSLRAFEGMPHVGGVALSSEEEKFAKLAVMLRNMFETRKKTFSQYGVSSLKNYRETVSENIPAVVLAIDNLTPIFELYPSYEDLILQIAREGASFGIHLLFTANTPNGIRYKITQNIKGAISFELNDRADYATLFGKVNAGAVAGVKGRGFLKEGSGATTFQAALYSEGTNEMERAENLKRELEQMSACWCGPTPERIPVMPETISMETMLSAFHVRTRIPVGYNVEEIAPAYLDLSTGCCAMILGSVESGKSRMLAQIGQMIHLHDADSRIYVVDSSRKGLAALQETACGYESITQPEALFPMINGIYQELQVRAKAMEAARKEQEGAFDEAAFAQGYPQLVLLLDDIEEVLETAQENVAKALRLFILHGQKLGLILLAAGRISDVERRASMDSLAMKFISSQNALLISGSASLLTCYQQNLSYDKKSETLNAGSGLLYFNKTACKIKLMQT